MIEEIQLIDSKVMDFSFKAIKEPSHSNGFYSYSVIPAGEIKCTDSDSHVELTNQAKITGYIGEPPENEENLNDTDKVFELSLSFRFIYLIPKEEKKENLLVEKIWFFETQAKIFSKQVIQSFLSSTPYHNITVPL